MNYDGLERNRKKILRGVIDTLQNECDTSDNDCDVDKLNCTTLSCIVSRHTHPISIESYIVRLVTYMRCSLSCLILSMIYIDRLNNRIDGGVVHCRTIHRLIIGTMVISAKYIEDSHQPMSYYAQCGGITVDDLLTLEASICKEVGYMLYVSKRQFIQWYSMYVE
jgi:hypothetical protein